jgi:hypothetical protein
MSETVMRFIIEDDGKNPPPQQPAPAPQQVQQVQPPPVHQFVAQPSSPPPPAFVTQPPPRPNVQLTKAEWDRLAKSEPGMREHLVKIGAVMPPEEVQQRQGAVPSQTVTQDPRSARGIPASVEEEANRRLERLAREKAIDQVMRSKDDEFAAQQETRDEERARRATLRLTTQQDRDEHYAARQEALEEKRAARERMAHERRQERDEGYVARQEELDRRMLQREVKAVPEAVALHDEDAYARNARASMADRQRGERQKQVRREIDPVFAEEEENRENREKARTMAMGGAAIGGRIGRVMGVASQVMASPETMRMLNEWMGGQSVAQPERRKDMDVVEQRTSRMPPPPAARIPVDERIQPPPVPSLPSTQTQPPASKPVPPTQPPKVPTTVSQPANAAAAGGAAAGGGAMAAASAAVPIAGAVMAVVGVIQDTIDDIGEGGRKFVRAGADASKAVLSMDVDQRMRAVAGGFDTLADSAKAVSPILGMVTPALKETVRGFDELRGVVRQSAREMSQYHGGLASQVAQQEVRELMRDIQRAQRQGPQMAAANEARFNFEQRVQDFMDRMMPMLLKFAEKGFSTLEGGVMIAEEILKAILRGVEFAVNAFELTSPLIAQIPAVADTVTAIRRLIAEALTDTTTPTTDEGWNNLMRSIGPDTLRTVTPMAPPPGPVVGMP